MRKPAPPPILPATPPVPRWIRTAIGTSGGSPPAFAAGAALALLDPLARAETPPFLLWRRRLALSACVARLRVDGRQEDEPTLRDHWALRREGDDPGPAGRLLAALRQLAEPRALRPQDWPDRLPALFDHAGDTRLRDAIADLPADRDPVQAGALAAAHILRLGPGYVAPALWLADAVLARGMGWPLAVPLLSGQLRRSDLKLATSDAAAWMATCCAAWAAAAVAAIDLHADLARRANRLLAASPKLRGRDAQAMVAQLLAEDALAAQAGAHTSDRASRRLFDRLIGLGAVRELTGRPTFRLYGL